MTKINVWQCDICKKRYEDTIDNVYYPISVFIEIPSSGGILTNDEDKDYKFKDVCYKCREKLISVIEGIIND